MAKKDKASGTSDQASGSAPEQSPNANTANTDPDTGNGGSQLGDSGDAADIQLEAQAQERLEKQAQLQREAAAKEEAAQIKRERLAAEAAEEKAKMREAEKANSIAAPAEPAAPSTANVDEIDPFTVPIGTLSDHELAEQWDALQSVEADMQEENAAREAVLADQEKTKEYLRQQRVEIEARWHQYQKRVNHVLLPRRDAIRQELNRREEAAKAAEEAAAVGTGS